MYKRQSLNRWFWQQQALKINLIKGVLDCNASCSENVWMMSGCISILMKWVLLWLQIWALQDTDIWWTFQMDTKWLAHDLLILYDSMILLQHMLMQALFILSISKLLSIIDATVISTDCWAQNGSISIWIQLYSISDHIDTDRACDAKLLWFSSL